MSHAHDEVAGLAVHSFDFRFALRINFADPGPFVDQLRLVVTQPIHLVSDLLVDMPLHDNANQFLSADPDPFHRHRPGWTALIREGSHRYRVSRKAGRVLMS